MILNQIVSKKKEQLKHEKEKHSTETLKKMAEKSKNTVSHSFYDSINGKDEVSIIAEIKRASPSLGIIKEDFDAIEIAKNYYSGGVNAISILTEKDFFLGSDADLIRVKKLVPIAILRKDFIIEMRQVYQSKYLGADAILLITAILSDKDLREFRQTAEEFGMDCLVEVHNRKETERALESGAKIIGINNRDLKTFHVDIGTTESLIKYIPYDITVVSESGMLTPDDILRLKGTGVDAVLVGETLMKASSQVEKIYEFLNNCKKKV